MAYDTYTKSLLHLDGSDASTTITDEIGKSVVAYNHAQLDTAIKKFGLSALLLDGTDDYILTEDNADFDFGTGDFTIDGWVYPTSVGSYDRLCAAGANDSGANNQWFFGFGTGWGGGNKMNFGYYNGAGYTEYYGGTAFTINVNTWYHWAVVRSGRYIYMYWNGIKNSTWDMGAAVNINSGTGVMFGARYNDTTSSIIEFVNGSMDEIRVSKGIARWTSDFTPPTQAYGPNQLKVLVVGGGGQGGSYYGGGGGAGGVIYDDTYAVTAQTYTITVGAGGSGAAAAAAGNNGGTSTFSTITSIGGGGGGGQVAVGKDGASGGGGGQNTAHGTGTYPQGYDGGNPYGGGGGGAGAVGANAINSGGWGQGNGGNGISTYSDFLIDAGMGVEQYQPSLVVLEEKTLGRQF